MLQPFELLQPVHVHHLEVMKKFYFVTQSYPRGENHFPGTARKPIVVSVYDDPGLAKTHWNAVKEDKYGSVINLTKPVHKSKLYEMLKGSEYVVYWAVVKSAIDLEKKINAKYKDHMRKYIEKNTNWHITRDAGLTPTIQLIFGELYINLKYGSQLIRIKFEDIENLK